MEHWYTSLEEWWTVARMRSLGWGMYYCSEAGSDAVYGDGNCRRITLPLLCSTQIAFFLLSIPNEPARVDVTVAGGVWRRPGPSLSACLGFEGIGRMEEGRTSPGSTTAGAVISVA